MSMTTVLGALRPDCTAEADRSGSAAMAFADSKSAKIKAANFFIMKTTHRKK
jgi:hypothetical protein